MNPSQGGGEGATFGSQSFAEIVELPNLTQGLTSQQLSQMDPFRLLTSSQQPSQQDMFPGGLGAGFGLGAAAPLFMPSQHESSLLNAMALASADPARFAAQSAYHVSMAPGAGKPVHHSLLKDEHRNSKAARRGPMDEMRQLVRIMVKLIPASSVFISEDNGGGNRVSEEQIREYLRATLGDGAPQPEWGLPRGWGQYLADLLAWATGSVVTKEQAMACARRPQGRSWEAVPEALARVNAYPHTWPLPLTFEGVRAANAGHIAGHGLGMEGVAEEEEHPAAAGGVAHPVGGGGIKREGSPDMDLPGKKRKRSKPRIQLLAPDDDAASELELWRGVQAYLAAALYKQGTTPVDKFGELASLREQVKAMLMKQPWFATLGGMGHHHGMGGQTLSVDARNVLAAAAGDVPPILLELLRMHPPGAAPLMGPLDSLFSQMGPPPLTGLVNHPLPVPAGLPTAASGGLPMAPPIPAPTALPPTALAGLQPGSAAAVTSGGGLLRPAPKKPHGEQGLAQQTLSDLGVGGDPAKQAAGATAPRLVTAVGSRFQPYNSAPQAGGAAGSADVKEESTVAGGGPPLAEGEGGTQADGDQALAGQRGSQELRQAIFDQMAANSAGADAGAGAGSGPASGSPAWKPSAILDALK